MADEQDKVRVFTENPLPNPLTLEQLGVKPEDVPLFCQEAKSWLGLTLNPLDLKKSQTGEEPATDFQPDLSRPDWSQRYRLMLRLNSTLHLEKILQSNILQDQEFIDGVNQLLADPEIQTPKSSPLKKLGAMIGTYCVRYYQLEDDVFTLPKSFYDFPFQDDDPVRDIVQLSGNFGHDRENIFPLNQLRLDASLLFLLNSEEELKLFLDQFTSFWSSGAVLGAGETFIKGYQEELVPGWVERKCDVGKLLTNIAELIGRRFSLDIIRDGVNLSPEEVALSLGKIELTLPQDLPQELPLSPGLMQRLVYTLVKNTAKAWSEENKKRGTNRPLEIQIAIKELAGNLLITMKDNGPGFDLNVPLPALAKLAQEDPDILKKIDKEVSPEAGEMIRAYLEGNRPFAIYPLTLKDLFQVFLMRRLSGSVVKEISPEEKTSGIGLSSVKAILTQAYGGSIWVTNHPQGGAYVLMSVPLGEDAAKVGPDFLAQI